MLDTKRDFIAESIADYEAMKQQERGQLIVQILEDQPVLMGYITNLADDFTDEEHEALVDSTVILINAFIAAGIPVQMVPHQLVEEVINEKVSVYESKAEEAEIIEDWKEISDSPKVFEDLRNRAFFKSGMSGADETGHHNFNIVLDTVITMVERSAGLETETAEDENS